MKQRHRDQVAVTEPYVGARQQSEQGPLHAVVGVHGALWQPGGAGGVHDEQRVTPACRRPAPDPTTPGQPERRSPPSTPACPRRRATSGPPLCGRLRHVRAGRPRRRRTPRRTPTPSPRVAQHERQLVGDQPAVQGDEHQPGPGRAVEDLDEFVAVWQQYRDPITLGEAQAGQHVRGPVGLLVEFGEGEAQACAVVDECLEFGIQLGSFAQMRSDVHDCLSVPQVVSRPPSTGSVMPVT